MSSSLDMRLALVRDLLKPVPGHDLLQRLESTRVFLQSEFARETPRTESSPSLDHLVRHPDLSPPSLYKFLNYGKSMKQDTNLTDCKDMFQIFLNVSQFRQEDIDIEVVDDFIVVHCKHNALSDGHGWVLRDFTRRFKIPADVESSTLKSVLNKYGILVITALKKIDQPIVSEKRKIPIEI